MSSFSTCTSRSVDIYPASSRPEMVTKERNEMLRKEFPELADLPPGWEFNMGGDGFVYFIKNGARTYAHPKYGYLPKDWKIKMVTTQDSSGKQPMYYNRGTGETTRANPRFQSNELERRNSSFNDHDHMTRTAATVTKSGTVRQFQQMERAPIATLNIRNKYEVVHTIDAGDGTLGAMNGGVFVVRLKGDALKLYVEKR